MSLALQSLLASVVSPATLQ
nr:unnamed protein product [Callosobruchus chinensis]